MAQAKCDYYLAKNAQFTKRTELIVYCNACEETFSLGKKSRSLYCVISHENSRKHTRNMVKWNRARSRQPSILESIAISPVDFSYRLAEVLVSCNIPWNKVSNKSFKSFIYDFCQVQCPDESTLRKNYLNLLYSKSLTKVRELLQNQWIYLQTDEAHVGGKILVSVLVGKLDGEPPKSYCLNLIVLERPADKNIISQAILDSLLLLWPDSIRYDQVRLLLSDQASYMMAAGRGLVANFFPNLIHVSCLCHALHRVCDKIREDFHQARLFINDFSNLLSRSSRRTILLEAHLGFVPEKLPICTRWGTWIKYCVFIFENYAKIKTYFERIKEEDASSLPKLIEQLNSSDLYEELRVIHNMRDIVIAITKLEERGLTIEKQKDIIDQQLEKLPVKYKEKLLNSLSKNPGYKSIFEFEDERTLTNYRFAPLVSVDVERSFSQLKCIASERRNFSDENLIKYAFVYFNNN